MRAVSRKSPFVCTSAHSDTTDTSATNDTTDTIDTNLFGAPLMATMSQYLVALFSIRRAYLAPEKAVSDDEVDAGEDDANQPPD